MIKTKAETIREHLPLLAESGLVEKTQFEHLTSLLLVGRVKLWRRRLISLQANGFLDYFRRSL